MSHHTALGPGAEFDIIRGALRRLGERAGASGDDCAVLELDGLRLAVSCDLAIEGTHFRTGWMAPAEVGWRASVAALSDLAAVAAKPLGLLASVGVSPEQTPEFAAELMEGVGDVADAVGARVLGGDVVKADRLVIDVTVLGRLDHGPVRRTGAVAGDVLYVTGRLGGPAAALQAWLAGREPDIQARERFVRPEARLREAEWLRERGAHALIDVSDGLLADAGQLAAASGVACVIDLGGVPVHPACAGPEAAVTGGEEYELLVACPEDESLASCFEDAFGVPLTRVGSVQSGDGARAVRDGAVVRDLPSYRHF